MCKSSSVLVTPFLTAPLNLYAKPSNLWVVWYYYPNFIPLALLLKPYHGSKVKGYLDYRQHCVRLEGHISDKLPVKSGVPRGSILGPILFLLYVNNIFPCASHSYLSMFADDTECLK